MIAILKKEMTIYFTSMLSYIFLSFFIFINAYLFIVFNLMQYSPDYNIVLIMSSVSLLIFIPLITMGVFSEELSQKTDVLLFTSPLNVWQIVLGKYFSAILLLFIGIIVTSFFPIIISFFGEIPKAQIISSFIGYFFLAISFISIGVFMSVLTKNRFIASALTFASLLFIYFIMPFLASNAPTDKVSSIIFIFAIICFLIYIIFDSTKNILATIVMATIFFGTSIILFLLSPLVFDSLIYNLLTWFSLIKRFENLNKGLISLSDIVYFINFSIAFIYFTVYIIEKRRWC